ncbi:MULTISPECIES: hypothetical protein [unclassified Agrococcus]|uniref:hypothetical protein n=1 Tax=unclassified Agrococcus TaxID=2615065 RepID=UPI00360AB2B5
MTDAAPPIHQPAAPSARPARRVLGIQPVLFVGMVLLVLVTLLTIVLVFVGDIETQAARVVWTVVALVGFTGLLALDLALARRSSVPLVVGVAANVYLLAILMLATWVDARTTMVDQTDPYGYGSAYDYEPPLGFALFGVYVLAFVVVRAAAAGAWALVALGRRGGLAVSRGIGLAAASLLGLVAVLLTLHLAIDAFGIDVGDLYWRFAVAAVVLAALAACITALLAWNRRHLEPRSELVPRASQAQPGGPQQPWPAPPAPGQPWPRQPWQGQPAPGQAWQGQPAPGQAWQGQPWSGQPMPGQPMPGQPWRGQPWPEQGAVPNPMQPAPAEGRLPHPPLGEQQPPQPRP